MYEIDEDFVYAITREKKVSKNILPEHKHVNNAVSAVGFDSGLFLFKYTN